MIELYHIAEFITELFFKKLLIEKESLCFSYFIIDKSGNYFLETTNQENSLEEVIGFKDYKEIRLGDKLNDLISINDEHNYFDSLHRVDVGICSDKLFPVEVKAGNSNVSKSFPNSFFPLFKGGSKYTLNKNRKIKGNMIKILDTQRKLLKKEQPLGKERINKIKKGLSPSWGLVLAKRERICFKIKGRGGKKMVDTSNPDFCGPKKVRSFKMDKNSGREYREIKFNNLKFIITLDEMITALGKKRLLKAVSKEILKDLEGI